MFARLHVQTVQTHTMQVKVAVHSTMQVKVAVHSIDHILLGMLEEWLIHQLEPTNHEIREEPRLDRDRQRLFNRCRKAKHTSVTSNITVVLLGAFVLLFVFGSLCAET